MTNERIDMILSYLNIFRSIPAFLMYQRLPEKGAVDADLRKLGQSASFIGLHQAMFRNMNCFRNLFYYRTYRVFPLMTKVSKLFMRPLFGLEIDVADGIGGGMQIYHGYSTIVFAKSIGRDFTVYQNVTLGRGKSIDGNDVPIIGDHVTVYTGAMIIGGVHVGDYAKIGAGVVITKDVPPYATVVNAPMRVLEKNRSN